MELQGAVQAILDSGVARGDVVGAAAQVVTSENVLATAAGGSRVIDDPAAGPMTTDTVCWIASMTKAVTGVAAMQLVERDLLHLDTPAAEVMSTLGTVGVLEGFDAEGRPRVRPARTPITLRHLLTHTAGFVYELWSEDLLRYNEVTGTPSIMSCERAALEVPALYDPGDQWMYGTGIDHVGLLVEEVSGMRLGDYLRRHVLDPLGMHSTSFAISDEMRERKAAVHIRGDDGSLGVFGFEVRQDPEVELGGAGLYGTVEDYSRFLQMILGRGTRDAVQVLAPETVDKMVVNNMGDLRVVPLPSAMPGFSGDAEFYPGVEKSWGLTFQINEEPLPTGRPAGGLMWAGLANSFYWIDMQNGLAGTYISQQFPFGDPRTFALFDRIERACYAALG
ncbi:MAG: serine hydrolase [bacterium]|nr:serine hydrolase [bacterium]